MTVDESTSQTRADDDVVDPVDIDADERELNQTYAITSYGADFPVDGLVKRLIAGDIYIPSFQRGYVWTKRQADRFIESLLMGLPVPGIFLAREADSQRLIVIDGQQRLRTLEFFYDGIFNRHEYKLEGVHRDFAGKSYKTLNDEDRRKLDDTIIHATIIRQDQPSEDDTSIYHIFERLNTGGTPLQAQEIRASIYEGSFNELLSTLDALPRWREIFGPPSKRLKDQELILRFLALRFNGENYRKPMASFLNNFMSRKRSLQDPADAPRFTAAFEKAIATVHAAIGSRAFRPERALNAAIFDAVMVGISRRLERGPVTNLGSLSETYDQLLEDDEFQATFGKSTTDTENVRVRLLKAATAFQDLQ